MERRSVLTRFATLAMSGVLFSGAVTAAGAADNKIEVIHLWTAASEAASMQVVKDAVTKNGVEWVDSAIAGASGDNLYQVVQTRVAAGNPPDAVQMHGQVVRTYAALGMLSDLTAVAEKESWEKVLPKVVLDYMKVDGKYVAVPLNMRRENILFINKKLLDKVGGTPPATWDDFFVLAEKFKQAGVMPLVLGGDAWQEAQIWTDIVVGQAGVDFYRKAVMSVDHKAIESAEMVKVFDTFRKVLNYADPKRAGIDWAPQTGRLIRGEAGMQFEGDWANGEFFALNKQPGVDFLCVAPPGNGHSFVALVDFFAMFKQPGVSKTDHKQEVLASAVMSSSVQQGIAIKSGSLPARLDVPNDKFNACSKQFVADRDEAIKDNSLVPSLVENLALPLELKSAFIDVITKFANTPEMTSQQAVSQLLSGLENI